MRPATAANRGEATLSGECAAAANKIAGSCGRPAALCSATEMGPRKKRGLRCANMLERSDTLPHTAAASQLFRIASLFACYALRCLSHRVCKLNHRATLSSLDSTVRQRLIGSSVREKAKQKGTLCRGTRWVLPKRGCGVMRETVRRLRLAPDWKQPKHLRQSGDDKGLKGRATLTHSCSTHSHHQVSDRGKKGSFLAPSRVGVCLSGWESRHRIQKEGFFF